MLPRPEKQNGRPEAATWKLGYFEELDGGAKGSRTPDLLNAIQALSQLSYGPTPRHGLRRALAPVAAGASVRWPEPNRAGARFQALGPYGCP